MQNGLITAGEIAHNLWMPWLYDDETKGLFPEILRYVDDETTTDHRQFFGKLATAFQELRFNVDRQTVEEWNTFRKLPSYHGINALIDPVLKLHPGDAKIRFYVLLSVNTAKAILLFVKNAVLFNENAVLSKSFITRTLIRIGNMITIKHAQISAKEDDIMSSHVFKLCMAIVFLEIFAGFDDYIEKRDIPISTKEMYEILTGIHMADASLEQLVRSLIHRHHQFFKTSGDLTSRKVNRQKEEVPNVFVTLNEPKKKQRNPDEHGNSGFNQAVKHNQNMLNPGHEAKGHEVETPTEKEHIIGSKEVMEMLGISESTFNRRIEKGMLCPLPRNKNEHYRFRREEILRLCRKSDR